jgi:DUF971 family protein
MSDEQPTAIKAFREQGLLEITWSAAGTRRLSFFKLRANCPCAGCVDELTGIRTLNVDAIPADIAPTRIELCGNYALKIEWNDGHSTGLYTWQRLAEMCAIGQAESHERSRDV